MKYRINDFHIFFLEKFDEGPNKKHFALAIPFAFLTSFIFE